MLPDHRELVLLEVRKRALREQEVSLQSVQLLYQSSKRSTTCCLDGFLHFIGKTNSESSVSSRGLGGPGPWRRLRTHWPWCGRWTWPCPSHSGRQRCPPAAWRPSADPRSPPAAAEAETTSHNAPQPQINPLGPHTVCKNLLTITCTHSSTWTHSSKCTHSLRFPS